MAEAAITFNDSAIPIIDIAPLLAGDPGDERRVADAVGRACRGIGFFYVSGHGIAPERSAAVFAAAARLFASPSADKARLAFTGAAGNRGYVTLGGESLDPSKPPDLKEAFNIGFDLAPDDPDLLASKPFRAANVWPRDPAFRSVMLDYFDNMLALGRVLHRAFAMDLNLPPAFFDDKFVKPMATLRLLHYPPVETVPKQGQIGAGVHTDYGNLTLLATDASGGLMVRDRAGRWLDAPVVPGTFICNIGDCLMRWSNDVYVSTPHKVVTPPGKDRYSVAFFVDPDPDAQVACLPTCLRAGEAPKYPPVTAADFLLSRLGPTYAGDKP